MGQNFLIDQNLLTFIVNAGDTNKNDIVIEIGSGTGALTQMLAERARNVVAVEIDKRLYEIAEDAVGSYDNVILINRDAIKSKSHLEPSIISTIQQLMHLPDDQKDMDNLSLKVISNLPYCISTPVIINLLESGLSISLMILTLQKDITNRLNARPGTKDYGILSIIAQHFSRIEVLKQLPPDVFWPGPKVESAIVKLKVRKKEEISHIPNYPLFQKVVRAIFTARRKTIYNALLKLDEPLIDRDLLLTMFKNCDIDPKIRGEALTVEKIIELTNEADKNVGSSMNCAEKQMMQNKPQRHGDTEKIIII